MKSIRIILTGGLLLSMMGFLNGCALQEKMGNVATEIKEAYENMVGKWTDLTDWSSTKIDQIQEATEDVKEAANDVDEAIESVDQAIESVQTVTGTSEEAAS
jgi:methyl-accepting chemotaxis protein